MKLQAGKRAQRTSSVSHPRSEHFAYWFARVSRALSQHLLLHMESQFGINLAEYRILRALADLPFASVKHIAADASLDKAQVSRAIADLTRRGLVIHVVDRGDRRLRDVTLTRAGRALVKATLPFVIQRQKTLEQRLTAAERQILWKALRIFWNEAERMRAGEAEARNKQPNGNMQLMHQDTNGRK